MTTRQQKLPAEQRRAVTVETVVELAGERNPGDITTAAIAERMKLTHGALFRHFPSKEAIWEAVMEWVSKRMLSFVDTAASSRESPLAALEAVFMANIAFVAEHPGVPRMIFGELQRAEETATKRVVRRIMAKYSERLREIIENGKSQGEIDPRLDAAAAAMVFIGTIQGLVMQSLLSGNVKLIRQQAPRAFAIYSRGLKKRP